MKTRRLVSDQSFFSHGLSLILLAALCLQPHSAAATVSPADELASPSVSAGASPGAVGSASSGLFAFWNSILGNQTRMIQVGLVIIAIGIFILTRSIR
jgi:hypothetical protein